MTTTDNRDVPDLEVQSSEGFWAQWDTEEGVVRVHQPALSESITLSPNEIRLLYGWVEVHKLT